MRIDGAMAVRLGVLAALGVGLYVAGWLMPDVPGDDPRVTVLTNANGEVMLAPTDEEPAISQDRAVWIARTTFGHLETPAVLDAWLGHYTGTPGNFDGLVWVVALDPGAHALQCYGGPAPTGNGPAVERPCPNYRTTRITVVVDAQSGDPVFESEQAEPLQPQPRLSHGVQFSLESP